MVCRLADFMGHKDKIRTENYRQPMVARDILKLSQFRGKSLRSPESTGNDSGSDSEDSEEDDHEEMDSTLDTQQFDEFRKSTQKSHDGKFQI